MPRRAPRLNQKETSTINAAVLHFDQQSHLFKEFAEGLMFHLGANPKLEPFIHFMKYRVKDSEHLREKLVRKAIAAKAAGDKPNITKQNVFEEVTDLAGVRILHLHTEQIAEINPIILEILNEHQYGLIDGPTAICWDIEYEQLFKAFDIAPESRDSMYTSVHYIVEANQKTKITAELQVRTLMEEVWGEVSHRVDYPEGALSRACRDQLKVLARLTSGSTRLVDSIFKSQDEGSPPED